MEVRPTKKTRSAACASFWTLPCPSVRTHRRWLHRQRTPQQGPYGASFSEALDGLLRPWLVLETRTWAEANVTLPTLGSTNRHVKNTLHHDRTGAAAECSSSHGSMALHKGATVVSPAKLANPSFPALGHMFGHLYSSVAPITQVGPATSTHWQSNEPIFSTRRTDWIRYLTKDKDQDTSTSTKIRNIHKRQDIHEHAEHVLFHVDVVLLQISGELVAAACC